MRKTFVREAIRLSIQMMRRGKGGPFGAIVVKGNKIVGRGCNQVTSANRCVSIDNRLDLDVSAGRAQRPVNSTTNLLLSAGPDVIPTRKSREYHIATSEDGVARNAVPEPRR